ncbi:uncharacterized protein [Ptychodera flava]|uniref:uncharacterized protein isoform X2 n=1 Tax=Ptychodera flava TaxID=63121 RepID=UPI00396AAA29
MAGKYIFSSTDQFELETDTSYGSGKREGCFVSRGKAVSICAVFCIILAGAVLITYFVPKCEVTDGDLPTTMPDPMPIPEELEDEKRDPFEGRLPDSLVPSLYKVKIQPFLDDEDGPKKFSFDGSVEIIFSAVKATSVITLHAHPTVQIDSSFVSVKTAGSSPQTVVIDRTERDDEYEFFKIFLSGNGLSQGQEYSVKIDSFTGTLHHSDFQGLYLSNYTEGEDMELRHLVATQFETTNTRRAFPCFDEPHLKAHFDVSIKHRSSRLALCNMPKDSTTMEEDDWVTTTFHRTAVVMPTYLIAIVVADFYSVELTTPNNVQFRVWSRKEAVHALNYSLHTGSEMLTFFEEYWDIKYPLPKQDMVAIPDFYFGAMENWGLVLYRETALLYDPDVNTQYRKHRVAALIAHELAHMWFGNLVTLAWWDHVWLNEAFASYYEYPALEEVEPSWDSMNQFHPRDDLYRALDFDDSWSSHPTVRPVGWPDDIWSQFDAIAYQRGSCLNLMMKTFLGKDTFKTGLQNYLNKYQYSNTESDDLFAELTEADRGKKDTDVKKIMDTWTLQMGYPIVTLSRDGNTIMADQERFIMDPNEEQNDKHYDMGYKWYIPLTYTDQSEMSLDKPSEEWMNRESVEFTLSETATDDHWYLVNIDYLGFYRVKYENDNWDKLAKHLKDEEHTTIPVRTRAQLLEDAFSIANAHQMDQVYSIKLLEYLSKETDHVPWYTAINRISYTRDMLKRTTAYGFLEKHMRSLINGMYYDKRWDFNHDDHLTYYKQIDAINTACYYGHQDCIDYSVTLFNRWLDRPETSQINEDIKNTVFCTAIKNTGGSVWEAAFNLYDNSTLASDDRNRLQAALACSNEQWTVGRYMEYALDKKETKTVIENVLKNSPIGYTLAWEFTTNRWEDIHKEHGDEAYEIVWMFADYMNTEADLMKLEAFGKQYHDMPGSAARMYYMAVDKVKTNINWMTRNYDQVYNQLITATKDPDEPAEDREPFDGYLPDALKPSLYTVTIRPYLDEEDGEKRFSFDGDVAITFTAEKETKVIVLHAHKTLMIDADTITVAHKNSPLQAIPISSTDRVEKYEFYQIHLSGSGLRQKEEYVVTIGSFTGTLHHPDFLGFYLSNYTEGDNQQRNLAATQFAPTAARKAFPCFDEPTMKAKFAMTIVHRNSRVALCNMPVKKTTSDGDWDTTEFETTSVDMSTYLVAMVIADFGSLEMTTPHGTLMRVWSRKDVVPALNYSLHSGSDTLTFFEDYFDIEYKLPKQDMVAIPNFYFGAMENWGLILYRETALLYDPEVDTPYRKYTVASIVAHELAHMWFGNLVTMAWWSHVWLNEGFASYLEFPALEAVEPTWDAFDQLHQRYDVYRALDYDDSWSSHPQINPIGWPDEIMDNFDTIAYPRGCALNRMMQTFLGESTFRTGLQNYLNKYQFSNTLSKQLFDELTEADKGYKDTNVAMVMDTWTIQMGYPIITLTRSADKVHAEQKRFIMDPNEEPNDKYDDLGYKWFVPLTHTDQVEMNFTYPHELWMDVGPADFTLSSPVSDDDWYLVNIDQNGFFRVKYEDKNWDKVAKFLKEDDHASIPIRTRAQLLDDAFSIAHAHQMDQVYSIKLLEYLSKETDYLPWYTAILRHGYTRDMLKRTAAYGYLEEHLRSLINSIYWEKRWDFSHDDHLSYYKQIDALTTACYYGHQDCVDSAKMQFSQWLDNPEDTSLIHVNIKSTVYCTAIKYGTEDVWERTWSLYDSGDIPSSERSAIRSALACTEKQWLIRRYLEYALAKNQANSVIGDVLRNSPYGYSLALEFTTANWDALREAHGSSAFSIVWQFADFMNTYEDLMKLEMFGSRYQYAPGFPESTYQSTVDKVKLNIQWVERNYEAVYQQLMDATNKTEEPPEREPFDGRLPETLKPSLYSISIKPYLDEEDGEKRFSFDGSVEMTFEVLDATDVIIFHAHDTLKVDDTPAMITVAEKDNPSQTIGVDRVEIVEKYEFVKVYLVSDMQMGKEYVLTLNEFTGTLLHSDLLGLYLSNYTEGENNDVKRAIATQFESTFARRAFPCFDEPQLKAKFEMTIEHRNSRIALWNMPVMETTQDGDWNTTVFERTNIVMPTYLIAIVVGDFGSLEITTANNKTMRVWSRKEEVSNLNYSLHVGSEILTYFEDYFEILDPLPKHDMVAVPDFGSGAMENWGLILYRESYLLYDPGYNSQFRKHGVAAVIAHELAHMWFGNLVTLAWWDHLWLNEAFASFLESPPLEVIEPTWQMFDQFHPRDDLYRALDHDDSWTSKPTVRPVGWPDEIDDMFDRVAYQRGSALVMMMRTFLGEETFKAGLQSYLNKYAYSNAVSHQLFAELTKADEGKKDTNVTQVMDTWTLQMGYPIVTVTRDGNVIHADQERFLMDPNETPNNNYYDMGYKWYVPLTYTDQREMSFDSPHETWMDMGPADFTLTTTNDSDWYLVNIDHKGLYRVKYENENWDKLAKFLKEDDYTSIPIRTRSQLIEESFSIANAHQMDQVYSIKIMEYLSKETEYLPWYTAVLRHGYTRDMLKRTAAYGYLEEHMRWLINNQYWQQRWDFSHDDHLSYYKQINALETACYYGHQDCVDNAKAQFSQWLDNPEDTNLIHFNIKDTVYCTAIKYGTEEVWEKTWSLYDSGNIPSGERSSIRSALACSKEQWIIKRYLDYALTKKEANSVIGSVLRNSPIGYSMAVEFTMANWDALRAAHGNGAFSVALQFGDFMNTPADLMKLEEFGRKNMYVPGFPENTYQSTVDKVKLNIQWVERNYEAVYQQLMDATNKTEEPPEREPFDGRLPETLKPSLYSISIKPYLDEEDGEKRFSFDGSVEMTFEVLDTTDVIIFHAHDTLKVDDTPAMITVAEKDNPSQTIDVDRVEIVEKYEFVKVYLVSDMQMGTEYVITLNAFTGTLLHSDLLGLYLSNYTEGENNDMKHAIATQFESTFARRAFPCFDEPQLKAKFEMTIEHRSSRIALWNMPVMETTQDGDWNTTVFERTDIFMPTYLIAIVVADFGSLEMTTANNKTMRVWCRKEEVSSLNYSLHAGSEILTYFEDYFGILDPLPKHDMVAVPDFGSGAMENWGLILYRESYLLYNPEYHTHFRKHGVGFVIAHELAHMWFGNLVTLAWWDHLWLNEAFASYLESPALDAVEPTWQMSDQFHALEDLYRAFDHDDSWTSKPTVRPVGWPDEIDDMFDRVAYQRGAALVMMMKTFLGEETFKAGLQSYLNEYAYSNAVSHQLFAELTKADEGKKDTNVTQVMDTWTLQMGYPIVTVTRDGNVIHADQERFLMDPNETPNNNYYDMGYKWHIPITFTDQKEMEFENPHEMWMNMGPGNFTLSSSASDKDWYLVNINHKGLYRVKYENENWDKLAKFLKDQDHTTIPVRTRSQLVEESFSIANAHQMDQVYSIKMMEYLSKETEYLPWYTAVLRHGYTRDMLKRTAAYGYLEEHMRWLINNQYWEQRWDFSHDDHLSYYKQINALKTACFYGHQDCVDNAKAQFTQWLDNPEDTKLINVDITDTVYCTAIKYGTDDVWERVWSLYDSENIPSSERSSIQSALACSKEQWIAKRYLEYALLKKETNTVIGAVLGSSPVGYSIALEFTMANWDALRQVHGNSAFNIVWQFADFMNTRADLMKLEEFGRKNMYVPGFPESTYQSTMDKVKLNIQWVERNYEAVYQQLMDATNKTEEPPEREPFDGRLPETLKPSLYSISIKPYLDEEDGEKRFSFDGSVEMTFEVLDATDVIIFHAHDTLKVDDTPAMITVAEKDNPSQTIGVDRVEIVEKYEFVKVYLVSDLQMGTEYVITLSAFTGTLLHSDLLGLYLSNYTEGENNDMKRAIATQFESTFARRAFPCFDEPQLKAKFEMTIKHRNSRIALWNMPVMETTQDGDWNTTVFERTNIVMPTYLIAIVVADFGSLEMTTANNKTMRVWCRKEEVSNLNYSLHVGSELLTYFEDYFEILDPLPKHDMVAVPDFGSGAMENWGLILYRESLLLYDPGYNSQFRKHSVAAVIAHELAHMWFGNLVTLAWWDHLWLNEAFASFLETPSLEVVEPTWQMFDQFHARDDLYRALDHDDSWTSKPTVRPVGWPDEIDGMFDRVAYQRGSALVMMMRTFLGEETFKAGLQTYLNKYAYSNAVSHQLFAELTKADEGKKDTDVKKVMDTWLLQMGYPVVTLSRDGNTIHAEQTRFIMDPNEEPNDEHYDMGYLWYVPVTYTDQSSMNFTDPMETWMDRGPADFNIPTSNDDDWYLVNINQNGFYRVKYEDANWNKLATYLKEKDHKTIPVRTRSQLLEDAFSIANAHQMDQVYSIKLLEYLSKETEYTPWYTVILRHGYTRIC